MITIVIMGIIFAIASSSWFVVETRGGVGQSIKQAFGACTNAVNRLSTWGVVLVPDKAPG